MRVFSYALCLGMAVVLAQGQGQARQGRGFIDEAEKLWDSLNTGIDHIQVKARENVSKLRPLAERVEEEMKPAVAHVNHALNNMASSLFGGISERQDLPSSGPGLDDFFADQFGSHGPLNPFSIFGISRRKQWWEGPNVCVERKVIEEDEAEKKNEEETVQPTSPNFHSMLDMTMTSCRDGVNFHECTSHINRNGDKKTIIMTYKCCYGFSREAGDMGCSEMVMKDVMQTMEDLEGREFLELVRTSDLEEFVKSNNLTIFMPSDDAIEDYRHDLEKLNSVDLVSYNVDGGYKRKKRSELTVFEAPSITGMVKSHIMEGFVDTSELQDELVLNTVNPDTKVRINVYNTYPEKVYMANCAKITSQNHFTDTGLVHTVNKVIVPASKTIGDIIESDTQFTKVAAALKATGMMDSLTKEGQFTFFAPTNAAMEKLDEKTLAKIQAGNGCSKDLLTHHLLPNVICSGVVESKARTVNAADKLMLMERDEEGNLFIEGKKVSMTDIVATNGVIHVLDEVIVPESAKSVIEALEENGSPTLAELFKLSGLADDINGLSNNTIFAPSERALSSLPKEFVEELRNDKEKLKSFLLYHVASPKTCKCDFGNNKELESGVSGKKLRLNVYDNIPLTIIDAAYDRQTATVQCAKLTQLDNEICGGMIHTVEKVLLPPGGNLVEVVKNSGRFEQFLKLIEYSELENDLNAEGPLTILAPTDEAFERLPEDLKKKAFEDKDTAVALVQHHTIPSMICCSGIPRHVPFFDMSGHRTMNGDIISLRRSRGGHIYSEKAEVTTCDMVADNGVVHAIDRVMVPDQLLDEVSDGSQEELSQRNNPFFVFKIFK